jgi:hypothetical protein
VVKERNFLACLCKQVCVCLLVCVGLWPLGWLRCKWYVVKLVLPILLKNCPTLVCEQH